MEIQIARLQRQEEAACEEAEAGQKGWTDRQDESRSTQTTNSFPLSVKFRALDNKIDLLRLRLGQEELTNCCVMVLVKTWLKNNMPDSVFQLDEREDERRGNWHLRKQRLVHKLLNS